MEKVLVRHFRLQLQSIPVLVFTQSRNLRQRKERKEERKKAWSAS